MSMFDSFLKMTLDLSVTSVLLWRRLYMNVDLTWVRYSKKTVMIFRRSQLTWRRRYWRPCRIFDSVFHTSGKPIASHPCMSFGRLGRIPDCSSSTSLHVIFWTIHTWCQFILHKLMPWRMMIHLHGKHLSQEDFFFFFLFLTKSEIPFSHLFTDQSSFINLLRCTVQGINSL